MTFMLAHERHAAFLQGMIEGKPKQLLRESDRQIANTAWLQIFWSIRKITCLQEHRAHVTKYKKSRLSFVENLGIDVENRL